MKKLKSLDLRHKAAARLKVEGKSQDQIAKELNVAKRTLSLWFSDDLVKAEIQRLASAVDEAFAEKLAASGLTALDEMLALGQRDTAESTVAPSIKIQALDSVMDRLPGLSRVRDRASLNAGNSGNGDTNIENLALIIGKMPDAELATTAKQLLTRASSGTAD